MEKGRGSGSKGEKPGGRYSFPFPKERRKGGEEEGMEENREKGRNQGRVPPPPIMRNMRKIGRNHNVHVTVWIVMHHVCG
jgi:hypothetical protein